MAYRVLVLALSSLSDQIRELLRSHPATCYIRAVLFLYQPLSATGSGKHPLKRDKNSQVGGIQVHLTTTVPLFHQCDINRLDLVGRYESDNTIGSPI